PAFLFEACRVKRLDAAALLEDPALAALDPDLDSVLNLNEPGDYDAARARPAPEVTVRLTGAPRVVVAATLGQAAAAAGVPLDGRVVVALDGAPVPPDPGVPLVAGDTVSFSASAG